MQPAAVSAKTWRIRAERTVIGSTVSAVLAFEYNTGRDTAT